MKHIESLFIFQLTLLVLLSCNLLGQSDAETTYRSNNKYITLLKSQELSYESKIKNPKDFVISANTNTLKLSENELKRSDSLYFLNVKSRELLSEKQYFSLLKKQKLVFASHTKNDIAVKNYSSIYAFHDHLKKLRKLDSLYCLYLKKSFGEDEYDLIAAKKNFSDYKSPTAKLLKPTIQKSETREDDLGSAENGEASKTNSSALGSENKLGRESETKEDELVNAETSEVSKIFSSALGSESELRKESETKEDNIVKAEPLESSTTNNSAMDYEHHSYKEKTSPSQKVISNDATTQVKRNRVESWRIDIPITDEQEKNMEKGFYIVNHGETLYRVSLNTKVTINKLMALNNLKTTNIYEGLKIKTREVSALILEPKLPDNTKKVTTKKWRTNVPVTDEQRKNMEKGFYVVNHGETLYRVSLNTKVSIDKLMALNNLKTANIYEGSKLKTREVSLSISEAKLPDNTKKVATKKWITNIPITDEQKKNMEKGFYVVNYGETLYRVSLNTKISINKLMVLNRLKTANIYPGTKLKIK